MSKPDSPLEAWSVALLALFEEVKKNLGPVGVKEILGEDEDP